MHAHVPSRISFIFYLLSFILLLSCFPSTNSPPSDEGTVRERVEVSGSIVEDTVWESGKEYVVTGDVTVEAGATLTIQPDVVAKFAHEHADDVASLTKYYGITVEGTLIADGGDSTGAILFTSGAEEWAKKPGDWRSIEVEGSSDSSSVIRHGRIQYADVGINADRCALRVGQALPM